VPHCHAAHELYGIDIMLDDELNVHLIEINISPSMSGLDSDLDQKLKYPLNLDVLRMGRMIECDASADWPCQGVKAIDNHCEASLSPSRLKAVESGRICPWEDPVFADFVIVRDYIEETEIKSGFRMAYPTPEAIEKYAKCFDRSRSPTRGIY
jgi:tubulin polyglutamylase TTLL4